ncbi:IclR family transcriptional regulator C-terminal domain-containing protein [Streptomyces peucetius]|uniref:Helix-turn-helix domain-containing protein n=1 Tax=Streptomyces peucetius TaxID=1950 RepID=A0ABY6IG44_STRPE|nr:IclR family transcriptional regulator C-terminal domain-containing protein [Streptomyces peucetius]UYQ65958.1 helix-turn-helix domain-containing protein [Streptomyces peucetius]
MPQPLPSPVGPLDRGLAVLRALSLPRAPDRVRHSELARTTGFARSTVDRVVSTLARLEMVRGDGREVALAPRLLELGGAYLAASGVPAALGPAVARLADEFGEPVSVAVPDQDLVRFVVRASSRRTMNLSFRVGDALPAERCAAGAVFRDGLEAACEEQLVEPGLVTVALPLRDTAGRTVCAVGVASHTSRHTADSLARAVLPRLRQVRGTLEDALAAPRAQRAVAAASRDLSAGAKRELGPVYLQSLARGLDVLRALGADPGGGMPLTAVAKATGLARATARRSLLTLEHLGYAGRGPDGQRFALRPRVLELGCARLSGLGPADIAQPHLAALVRQVGESASLAVLDGSDIRYVARVPTVRIMSIDITVGTRFPAYATAMGRVLLAGLPAGERPALPAELPALTGHTVTSAGRLTAVLDEVAVQGHALVDQELEEGLRSLAVPVRDRRGRVVAALNVAQHAGRGSAEGMRATMLAALRETAGRVETELRAVEAVTGVTGAA